jgi:hypothetical protein
LERSGLKILILIVALIVAAFHALLVQFIAYSLSIGGYFLVATILFAAGAFATLSSGKLLKPALVGLFILALIDSALILITTSVPTPLSGGQVFGWSTDWNPPGQVQVLIAQIVLMILTGYALLSKRKTP